MGSLKICANIKKKTLNTQNKTRKRRASVLSAAAAAAGPAETATGSCGHLAGYKRQQERHTYLDASEQKQRENPENEKENDMMREIDMSVSEWLSVRVSFVCSGLCVSVREKQTRRGKEERQSLQWK